MLRSWVNQIEGMISLMKKQIGLFLVLCLLMSGCTKPDTIQNIKNDVTVTPAENKNTDKSIEEIVSELSLDHKAAQMVQGAVYQLDVSSMEQYDYGSVLSTFGERSMNAAEWKELILRYQNAALKSESGIPFIYGNDAVHGVNTCSDTVIFPHNIGIGAANDDALTYEMGRAVANEAKLTGMLWNFSPCVAAAQDPRWGRTYESYSSDTSIITKLSTSYARGLMDEGILPCAKHFLADGNVLFGTGENLDGVERLIDRGDAQLDEAQIQDLLLVYQSLIDAGVETIMISHGSLNGIKMHENAKYIKLLKEELNFEGFIVSDWNSIHNITGKNLKEQTITAINAGIDMLMEDSAYEQCRKYIVEAVKEGKISTERVDDAVTRILKVKKNMGILDDPSMENVSVEVNETGESNYRDLAKSLVEKSMVLLKNDKELLPIKPGTKIFVTGPAADDIGVQCGGWTITWTGNTDANNGNRRWISGGTSILEGLNEIASEYNLTIITDQKNAQEADMTLLCLGEKPYAEWEGDSEDISITGSLALPGNKEAIEAAKEVGLPTVTLLVAGRNVIIKEYMSQWDGIVMCYLPGSEGAGIGNVLTGKSSFSGTLPMPYYLEVEDIRTDRVAYPIGFGLTYAN